MTGKSSGSVQKPPFSIIPAKAGIHKGGFLRDAHYRKDVNKENRKEKIESILMEPPPLSGSFVSALQEKENRKEAQAHSQADERPVSTNAKFQLNDLPPILWEV